MTVLIGKIIPVPQNMDEVRSQLLTPRGMSMSPINTPNVHVPADYMPASPMYSPYSPTSPDYSPNYSPSMSPDPIATNSVRKYNPINKFKWYHFKKGL